MRRPPLLGSVGSCHKRWLAVMAAVCVSASVRAERIGLRMLTRAKKAWELSRDRGFGVRHANQGLSATYVSAVPMFGLL